MTRKRYINADETDSIEAIIWGPEEQVKVDATYTFSQMVLKTYKGKKLSTTPESNIR